MRQQVPENADAVVQTLTVPAQSLAPPAQSLAPPTQSLAPPTQSMTKLALSSFKGALDRVRQAPLPITISTRRRVSDAHNTDPEDRCLSCVDVVWGFLSLLPVGRLLDSVLVGCVGGYLGFLHSMCAGSFAGWLAVWFAGFLDVRWWSSVGFSLGLSTLGPLIQRSCVLGWGAPQSHNPTPFQSGVSVIPAKGHSVPSYTCLHLVSSSSRLYSLASSMFRLCERVSSPPPLALCFRPLVVFATRTKT